MLVLIGAGRNNTVLLRKKKGCVTHLEFDHQQDYYDRYYDCSQLGVILAISIRIQWLF